MWWRDFSKPRHRRLERAVGQQYGNAWEGSLRQHLRLSPRLASFGYVASIFPLLCSNRNETCEVRYGEDKRNNGQTQDNKALHQRIAALEDLIKNMSQPTSQSMATLSNQSNRHELGPDSDAPPAQVQQQEVDSSAQGIAEFFPSEMDEVATLAAKLGRDASARNSQYFGSPSLFSYSKSQSGPERLSRARLFGGEQDISSPADEISQRSRAALEASPEPEPIVAHLLDLFWKWQSCHLLVIDREIFLCHRCIWDGSRGNGDRTFYTPCLLYALLAMAALISPDAGVKRYSTHPAKEAVCHGGSIGILITCSN
ncbi:unnamed protein product [Clonostachys solani]|uniref:Uncharacterized protein n=1 Tax=Clonostachys solani TaxID=160281 RepID=A0A9N9ZAC3_9HYPO|nr:unnamed protein product [Clonostachys solani]